MNKSLKTLIGGASLAALLATSTACAGSQTAPDKAMQGCGTTTQPSTDGACGAKAGCGVEAGCGSCGSAAEEDYYYPDEAGCGGCGGCGG